MSLGVGESILAGTTPNHLCHFVVGIKPVENSRLSRKLNFKIRELYQLSLHEVQFSNFVRFNLFKKVFVVLLGD